MLNTKSLLVALMIAASCVVGSRAQDCNDCAGNQFGYPATGCRGGIAGHLQHHKENREAWKEEAAKIKARNDAWPKPFACHDRMAYYSVWDPMIHQGYANHCVLGDDHFQSDNNQLNQAGQRKVAAIMQNLPAERRQLLITNNQNSQISQERLANVNQIVQTFYGQSAGSPIIALTDRSPALMSGLQADKIFQNQMQGLPAPIIPVVSAGQGISSSTTQ